MAGEATTTMAAPAIAPVAGAERIVALDVLRGIALLGIVVVNVSAFAMPMQQAFQLSPAEPAIDRAAYAIVRSLFQLKFISIFSLLFGAGLAIQVMRAGDDDARFVGRYARRLVIMLAFGLAHAILLWFGDILVWYATLGWGLLLVRRRPGPTLLRVGAAFVVVGAVIGGTCAGAGVVINSMAAEAATEAEVQAPAATDDGLKAELGAAGAAKDLDASSAPVGDGPVDDDGDAVADDPPRGFAAIAAAQGDPAQPVWQAAETIAYREGPWIDAMAFRLVTWGYALLFGVFGFAFVVFGLFLIGAGLIRTGFFRPDAAATQRRVAIIALSVAVPLEFGGTAAAMSGSLPLHVIADAVHTFSGPGMAIGLLAGITWLVSTGRSRRWEGPIRSAGQAALSVYIGETVIGTAIFYHWGAGLFGEIGRMGQLGIAVAIWASLVVAATIWLRAFRFGPLEWVWRTATYGRLQPMRRRDDPHPRG